MFKVQWNLNCEQSVASVEDLDSLLDKLHAQGKPVMAVVEFTTGDSLAIGLGRSLSVLNFVLASSVPLSYTSLGSHCGDETIQFDFMGSISEFAIKNVVPTEVARSAMREFVESGQVSSKLEWEQD
jgi:hypothetical protein